MKITFGRKFLGCLIALLILTSMFFTTLIVNSVAITATSLVIFGLLIVTICFAYIGANVWQKWVQSKYFKLKGE